MGEGEVQGRSFLKRMERGIILLTNHRLSFDGFDIPISNIKSVQEYTHRIMKWEGTVMRVHTKDHKIYNFVVTKEFPKTLFIHNKTRNLISLLDGMVG